METNQKKRLIELGAETLADAILTLAETDTMAAEWVERLLDPPNKIATRFHDRIADLKVWDGFVHWRESEDFARSLALELAYLKTGISDPRLGVTCVAAFFETDQAVLNHCDDSSGFIGDVYRFDAKELFIHYAQDCPDKDWLCERVWELNHQDDYGVRDRLIEEAITYLPEQQMRRLVAHFQAAADEEADEFERNHWYLLVESLARQLKDPELFKATRSASGRGNPDLDSMDIAAIYLESGDPETARAWMEKVSEEQGRLGVDGEYLRFKIAAALGDRETQAILAYRMFRRHRTEESLTTLLTVIGQEAKSSVVEEEVGLIHNQATLSLVDAHFLVVMDRMADAEQYILKRATQLDGDNYPNLLPLAEAMSADRRILAAVLIYRSLLSSILRRGYTKAYPHGVRYLKHLDRLSPDVADWGGHEGHANFLQAIRKQHGRKRSFWAQYSGPN